ncbi:TIGR03089 family protein [Sciscionella marina]|uniref:TIGR03089 family protein n=1 Tax=Sciscionella marina TaxID=508770 RepID=UPI0003789EC9|nr:TIGR03089 family protein [Sciscionella marina]
MGITESVLVPLLRTEASRPLITHYDDEQGSRVELSVATTANWAAKTANWLREETELEPGDPVGFTLPPHWQTLGILFGVWWCGGDVRTEAPGAPIAFVPEGGSVDGGSADAELTAEVSLHPMGLGLSGEPTGGAIDFVEDARLHGDDFVAIDPAGPETAALAGQPVATVLERARERASELGIERGTRVLSTADWTIPDGLVDVLAVFAAGGALVQCTNVSAQCTSADPAKLEERANTERCTLLLPA